MFTDKKKIYILIFALLVVFLIAYKFFSKNAPITKEVLPPVTIAKAELGPVVRYINAIGTLRPFDSVVIKSEVNSMISKIHFTEGTVVEENTLLIELDNTAAKAALMEAEAQYRKTKSEYEPIEKLADKGVMAKIERDKKKAEVDMCEAKVLSSKNTLEKHRILAPFGGIVGLREISKGQYVAPGNELVKLVDCHPLKVDFKVTETDIGKIYVGQEAKILVGGDNRQGYTAKITAVDPESDRISHSFDIRATLEVPAEVSIGSTVLKPGRFVSVKVIPDDNQRGILIPESAIDRIGDDDYVYRIVDGVAVRTLITSGMRRDGLVEVITGINENDIVITSGQNGVLDGKGVSIQNQGFEKKKVDKKHAAPVKKKKTKSAKGKAKKQIAEKTNQKQK